MEHEDEHSPIDDLIVHQLSPIDLALYPKDSVKIRVPGGDFNGGNTGSPWANAVGSRLKNKPIFLHDNTIVIPDHERKCLEEMTPQVFRGWIELNGVIPAKVKDSNDTITITREPMSRDLAEFTLAQKNFRQHLRPILRTAPLPRFWFDTSKRNATPTLLPIGYHPESRTYTFPL